MKVFFATKRVAKQFDPGRLEGSYNPVTVQKIQQRMNELLAAPNLATLSHLPPMRCHALKGKQEGCFSVSAGDKVRIVFESNYDPVPRKPDGGIDETLVTEILITYMGDYHE